MSPIPLSFSLINIVILAIGYFTSIYLGKLIINTIITKLWMKHFHETDEINDLKIYVGYLDRFIYTTAFLLGAIGFIPIWLVVRTAGDWPRGDGSDTLSLRYLSFIGNGLSLVLSILVGWAIQLLVVV